MADHELEIVARYKDLASKGIKSLGTSTQKMATKAATAMRVVGSAAKKMGKRVNTASIEARKALNKIAGPLKLLTTAVSIASGAISFKLIGIASDAAETASKFNVLFGTVEESANGVADKIASSFGRSKADVRDYMGTLQALLTPMDLVGKQGLDMSATLAKLAIDMASFANASDSEALLAIRSGLSGESEPLRRFGIFLSEARVKTEALTLGIAKQGDELTNQQKILARYSIIQKDSVVQQGDAIRTANEYEGKMKRLGAKIKDLAVIYGDRLKVAVLGAIEDMGGIDGVMVLVETAMGSMVETVGRLIPKLGEFGGKMAESIKSIGGAAEVVVRLSDAYDRMGDRLNSIAQLSADIDLGAASTRMRAAQHELIGGDEDALSRLVTFTEDYLSAMTRMGASSKKLDKVRERVLLLNEVQERMLVGFIDMGDPLALTTGELRKLVEEARALEDVISGVKVPIIDPLRDAADLGFDPLTDAMLGSANAAGNLEEALARLHALQSQNLPNLPNSSSLQGPSLQGPSPIAPSAATGSIITSDEPTKKVTALAQAVSNLRARLGSVDDQLVSMTETAILNFGRGLTNALASMINPMKSGKQAMKEFAASFLADISAMIAKALIFRAIMAAFSSFGDGAGPVGSGGGGVFGSAGGAAVPSGVAGGSSSIFSTYGGPGPGPSSPPSSSVNVAINISAMDGADVQRVLVGERGTLKSIIQDAMMTSPSFRSTMLGAV